MLGDFNVNYRKLKDERTERIVEAIKTYNLKDLARDFLAKRGKPYRWAWRRIREGDKVQAICDYILHGSKVKWKNFKAIDLIFDTDHHLIKGKLKLERERKYKAYMKESKDPRVDLFGKTR